MNGHAHEQIYVFPRLTFRFISIRVDLIRFESKAKSHRTIRFCRISLCNGRTVWRIVMRKIADGTSTRREREDTAQTRSQCSSPNFPPPPPAGVSPPSTETSPMIFIPLDTKAIPAPPPVPEVPVAFLPGVQNPERNARAFHALLDLRAYDSNFLLFSPTVPTFFRVAAGRCSTRERGLRHV